MRKFRTVAVYAYPANAAVMKSKLESEGVVVLLRDEFTIGVDPFASQAIGGVKMDVHVEDYVKALGIIELNSARGSGLTNNVKCSSCGKRAVSEQQDITAARNFKERLQAVVLSVNPFSKAATYRCNNCEHIFNEKA